MPALDWQGVLAGQPLHWILSGFLTTLWVYMPIKYNWVIIIHISHHPLFQLKKEHHSVLFQYICA